MLEVNERLLNAIAAADWKTYEALTDESLTAYEPEAPGHLIEGKEFHKFFFDNGAFFDGYWPPDAPQRP